MTTCDVCMKRISDGRYCEECAEAQVPLRLCAAGCGTEVRSERFCKRCTSKQATKAKASMATMATIPAGKIDNWSSLTRKQKEVVSQDRLLQARLTPKAKRQYRTWTAYQTLLGIGALIVVVATPVLLVIGIVNAPATPPDIRGQAVTPSAESSATPQVAIPTSKPVTLVAGAADKLWTYLNDNFDGTDWFLWVDSAKYYVDGPVRVIDLNLNGFISTDREAAKRIAQTACIAIYTFWIDQERNGKRAFEVLFVGDGSGNVYRREDYAAGERCSGD